MSNELTDPPAAHLPDARWPERSQRLLGEVRALCSNWLHQPLLRTLDHFDTHLNQQAERTRSHLDQVRYQATRKLLLNERQTFDQRFIASIDQAFDRLGQPIAKPSASLQMLSLVDPLEHELTTSLDQLVARSEARGGVQLVELGYRLAALIASAPLEGPAVPIGPQAMANAFGEASTYLGLPSEHGLLLLQSLEGSLIQGLSALHELVNAHLQTAGILPFLRPFALPRATPRRERSSAPAFPATTATDASTSTAEAPDKRAEPAAEAAMAASAGKSSGAVSNAELQAALLALQEHLMQADEQHRLALRDPQRLREELLIQLAVGRRSDSSRATLSTEQDDALEMIARLFKQMVEQLPTGCEARTLLGNLQLPMLRVALHDHLFFEQHKHPARRLLGRVAQIARDWFDDTHGETDRALRTRMNQLVERAGREPPTNALYQGLLDDIDQYLAQLQHRTQLAERRQIEAMQGLERLEQARQRCSELLASRFAPASPQRLRINLLGDAWRDVLALTLLRHGEQSEVFQTRMVITDQLLGALPMGNRSKLEQEVIASLGQIGQLGDPAMQMAQQLMDIRQQSGDHRAEEVSNTMRLADLSPQPGHDALTRRDDSPMEVPAVAPAGAEVLRIHRHLRSLPSGVWFEFGDPLQLHGKRLRLVWYSPLSGHSLFVTRRGERAEEFDQLELATEIARGSIRELPAEQEDMLDHAWRVVSQELGHATLHGKPGAGK